MARIVLSTIGTNGDYLAFAGLGQALCARGHDVVVAVNRAAHRIFKDAGLAVAPCGLTYGEDQARAHPELFDQWDPMPGDKRGRLLREIFDLERNYKELLSACEGADLLVAVSLQLAAPRVHDTLSIPWVAVSLLPADLLHETREEELPPPARPAAVPRFAKVGLTEPLPGNQFFLEYLRAPRTLLASSLHYSQPRLECYPSFRMTGFWFYEGADQRAWQPTPEVEAFTADRPGPIALSFGSLPVSNASEVVAIHARAAKEIGLKLLVQRGWARLDLSAMPSGISERDVLITGPLPHDWLLKRSSAIVHHGGIGTTARAIRNNCPMVIEPYGRDQFFNAWRVTSLGVGMALHPHKLTADGLARALERVLSPRFTERVGEVGELLRSEDGYAAACHEIEEFIDR